MLYLVGLGLWDKEDISLKGKKAIERSDNVYIDTYTSILMGSPLHELEELYGKAVNPLDREGMEQGSAKLIEEAKKKDIAILVGGDALGATTHISLIQEAKEKGVDFQIIHNASILNAVSIVGLELYKYGQVTSIPFDNPNLETPYEVIKKNKSIGLHTLLLLDLNPKENRFMTVNEAIEILLKIAAEKEKGDKRQNKDVFTKETMCVGCARLGGDYKIAYGKAIDLMDVDFGKPLHCLIVPGKLHFVEEEMLEGWRVEKNKVKGKKTKELIK